MTESSKETTSKSWFRSTGQPRESQGRLTERLSHPNFSIPVFSIKVCKACGCRFIAQSWATKCMNCNPQFPKYNNRALLNEHQLLELLDIQKVMQQVNQLLADNADAIEAEAAEKELEELKARAYAKCLAMYEKAHGMSTHSAGPGCTIG